MSRIAVRGAETGSGVFTIQSPTTNTDRTLTLPDEAGTVLVNGTTSNVGIGTSSPGAKLDVRGSSTFLVNATNPTAWVSVDSALTTGSMYNQWNTTSNVGISGTYTNHPYMFVTNNTERMRIDTAGRVTMPYQPAFTAIKSDNTGQVGSGVYIFNQVTLNVGNHYNNTNGRFTAPISGVYYFITRLQLYGTSSYTSIYFTVNGSNTGGGDFQTYDQVPNTTTHRAPHHAALLSLTAGDYVEVVRSQSTRGMQSNFCGYLVG
jgi:hypothetical protein